VWGTVFAFIWERPAGWRVWLGMVSLFLGGGFLASVRVDKLFPVKTTHPMDSQKGPVFLFPLVECFKWLGIHLVVIAFSWASF